ncbi:MAG: hypothetical protein WCO63_15630 [Bacteroidota bacterium]
MKYTLHLILILSVFFLLYMVPSVSAQIIKHEQISQKPPFMDRLFFGGNLGLSFGTVTLIDISPLVGYKISPQFVAGLGLTYQYYQDNTYTPAYKTDVYGGRVFARYYTKIQIFLHTEYEILNYLQYTNFGSQRVNENNFYVGGGYSQNVGGRVGAEFLILYNLNQLPNSMYPNPIYRIGIGVGI